MDNNVGKNTENYKENLILYWQQFYPDWQIPAGYHVHHIKPVCTFEDPNDPKIHHPSNLIALHVDDHTTIHNMRGDKLAASLIWSMKGRVVSEETKSKMSQTHKTRKRKPLSEEHKRKLAKANKGRTFSHTEATKMKMRAAVRPPRQPVSDETRQKLSLANKGRKVTAATRQKISQGNKGRKATDEQRRAQSIARTGKSHSEETKMKMSESAKRRQPMSEETKMKMRGKRPNFQKPAPMECPHCGIHSNRKHINFCQKVLNT